MKVAICGGGLVGSLMAVYMAQRGHEVHVFEARVDPRTEERYTRQSINLALSKRGRDALARVGMEEMIAKNGIEMHSRWIHAHDGHEYGIKYGTDGQSILAIDRRNLNERLLDAAEALPNVKLHFEHKLVSAEVDTGVLSISTKDGVAHLTYDLVIGADGAHSALRRDIMRRTRMDYSQMYIPHAYKELRIPPGPDGDFQMRTNYLHIWPRHHFMLIALPNPDKSFTVTLFMPWEIFESIKTPEQLISFFEANFSDAIPLIGKDSLIDDFFHNPTSPLITIKSNPYHSGRCVIMGDAAHAMVPFYGQGMNTGFEDCKIFCEILDHFHGDVAATLPEYSKRRHVDAQAICDLALANYVEMRSSVTSTWFLIRKKIDNFLHAVFSSSFIPLYTMVTFSTIPYSQVIEKARRQNNMINTSIKAVGLAAVVGALYGAARYRGVMPHLSLTWTSTR